jgi:hypothetical protein
MPKMTKKEFAARLLFWLLPWPISKALPRSLRIYYFGPTGEPPSGWYDYWGEPFPGPIDPYNPPPPDQFPDIPDAPVNPVDPYTPGPGPDGGSKPIVIGDSFTVTAETSDGMIFNGWGADWLTVRNAGLGVEVQDAVDNHEAAVQGSLFGGDFGVGRSFLSFDLSDIPAGVVIHSCILKLSGFGFNASRVCVQRGTNTYPLAFADYPKFYIDLWGISEAWELLDGLDVAINSITLNSVAIGYIQSRLSVGTVQLCLREYDHDFLNVEPDARYRNGFYYAENVTQEKPRLVIN